MEHTPRTAVNSHHNTGSKKYNQYVSQLQYIFCLSTSGTVMQCLGRRTQAQAVIDMTVRRFAFFHVMTLGTLSPVRFADIGAGDNVPRVVT